MYIYIYIYMCVYIVLSLSVLMDVGMMYVACTQCAHLICVIVSVYTTERERVH